MTRPLEAPAALEGAFIERVDRPWPGLYAFSLALSGKRLVLALLVGQPGRGARLALMPERPKGEPADGEVRGLREKLEGGRIQRTSSTKGALGFEVLRGEVRFVVQAMSEGLSCVAPPADGAAIEGEAWSPAQLAEAVSETEAVVAAHRASLTEATRLAATAMLRRTRQRIERRVEAVERDLLAVEQAEQKAQQAALFVPQAAKARQGQTSLVATDWSTGEAREITFPLDPAKPPKAQLDAVFDRAKRLREGAARASRRREEAQLAVLLIDELLSSMSAFTDAQAIEQALSALGRQLPGDVRLVARQRPAERKPSGGVKARPFRRYESSSGAAILVGRDALSNDELTTAIARPGDLWLHARGTGGAHVVVSGWSREREDPQTLLDAATLAAHFSELRDEAVVEVIHTERRYVRKRRGSAPGQVEIMRERVLALRLEPERLARLLATADRDVSLG